MSLNNNNTKELQSYIILKSLDTPLPNVVAGAINDVLPGFEIAQDEDGNYIKGADIQNATYRQRILCNFLTDYPLWDTKEQCERVVNNPKWIYSPKLVDPLNRPITPADTMVGNSYHLIPFVRIEGMDDSLKGGRDGWKAGNPTKQLKFPEGHAIEKHLVCYYFEQIGE